MQAAVVTEAHTFDVVDVADPTPGRNELVLRVAACGICGSDLKAVHSMPAGYVMGHEFAGEVVAIGADVDARWKVGVAATAMPVIGCGRCAACATGEVAHCVAADLIGVAGSHGAYAEYVRVSAAESFLLPGGISPDLAALVEPLAVGLHAVNAAALRPGERVLVLGAGPVGLAVTTWARGVGAGQITVVDPSPPRRDAATTFGASYTMDPADDGVGDASYDVVFECVGKPGMLNTCVSALKVHGRVVLTGVCIEPDPFVPVLGLMKEVSIRFAVYYTRGEFATVIDAVATGRIDPAEFVTGRVPLTGVTDAFQTLSQPNAHRKVLVTPERLTAR